MGWSIAKNTLILGNNEELLKHKHARDVGLRDMQALNKAFVLKQRMHENPNLFVISRTLNTKYSQSTVLLGEEEAGLKTNIIWSKIDG